MARNYLLLSLFVVLLGDQIFGLGLSLMPGLSFKNLYLYLIVIYLMAAAVVRGDLMRASFPRIVVLFGALCVYAGLSWYLCTLFYRGYSPMQHLLGLKNQLVDPMLFFSVFFFAARRVEDAMWIAKRIALALGIVSILLLMDFFNLPDLGLSEDRADGRLTRGVGSTNEFAAFLCFFVSAIVPFVYTRERSKIVTAGVFAGVMLILLTGSRGALVGIVLGSVMATVLLRHHVNARNVLIIGGAGFVVLAIMAILVVILNPEMFYTRLERTDTSTLTNASSGRTAVWAATLGMMYENPHTFLVGFGWDMFIESRIYTDPHNYYLLFLYNTGAVGLGMLLWLFWSVTAMVRRGIAVADESARPYLISFVYGLCVLLASVLFVVLYTPWPFIWSYTGLIVKGAWLLQANADEKEEISTTLEGQSLVPPSVAHGGRLS